MIEISFYAIFRMLLLSSFLSHNAINISIWGKLRKNEKWITTSIIIRKQLEKSCDIGKVLNFGFIFWWFFLPVLCTRDCEYWFAFSKTFFRSIQKHTSNLILLNLGVFLKFCLTFEPLSGPGCDTKGVFNLIQSY